MPVVIHQLVKSNCLYLSNETDIKTFLWKNSNQSAINQSAKKPISNMILIKCCKNNYVDKNKENEGIFCNACAFSTVFLLLIHFVTCINNCTVY